MAPESIPQKYGGKLDWSWGSLPDLDDELRAILEQDGNKGWVRGPALWLNNERVVVGSENGKLRRSDKEIAEKKPIVYAADYTEEPVHPEKRLSIVSAHKKSLDINGQPNEKVVLDHPSPLPESPNAPQEDKQLGHLAPSAAAVAPAAAETNRPATPQKKEIPTHLNADNVRTSPMGDSQVHLPDSQPAPPATTAEYISPTPSRVQVNSDPSQKEHLETEEAQAAEAGSVAAATAATTTVPPQPSTPQQMSSPPPGHAQPGPLPAHTAEINRTIASKLEQESTVTIPASANGLLPHPEVVVASDASKGLAMEEDKLALKGDKTTERPQPERFVTAQEIPQN